jgi:HEAT repeat protein
MDREHLARLLDAVGNEDEDARRELLAYINRQPAGIQALAYEALNDGGEDTYDQLMLTLADDPALYIRPPLPPLLRRETTESTGEIPASPIHPRRADIPSMLITTLRTGERIARVNAARAMADYGPDAAGYLMEALKSDEPLVMAAAAEALQAIGGAAVSAVLPLTGDNDQQRQWYAYKVLSTTADASALPTLIAGIESSNSGVRWLAAEGLVKVGRSALRPLLQRLNGEKLSVWLRNGTVHALNKIRWADEQERHYYTKLAHEIKVAPTATLSHIARRELEQIS